MIPEKTRACIVRIGRALGMVAIPILLGACLSLANAASAQDVGYMRVLTPRGQMAGESTDPAHDGWILVRQASMPSASEIAAIEQGSSADSAPASADTKTSGGARSANGSASASTKYVHRPVVIIKYRDSSSLGLLAAMTSHEHFPEVDIVLMKGDQLVAQYKLTDATVISIRAGGPSGSVDVALEQLRLNYAKIELER
jgi:type VI protein secretion system component Hcp